MARRESLPNPYRLTVEQFVQLDGRTLDEILAAIVCDLEPAPALCTQFCEVEWDLPSRLSSLLRAAGVI